MNREVFSSLLALDSYNRGYGALVNLEGDRIGNAQTLNPASSGITEEDLAQWESEGFYAIAYDLNGETIIYYRGTNFPNNPFDATEDELTAFFNDFLGGWSLFTGLEFPVQTDFAREFLISTTGTGFTGVDPISGSSNITLTGNSLGGGEAGLVSANDNDPGFDRKAA